MFKRILFPILFCFTLLLLLPYSVVHAEERITSFNSRIEVMENGELVVEETISIIAEGVQIKRGIYRDFPTDYKDENGFRYQVDFTVVAVKRDDRDESFHTEKIDKGVRVYMGEKDVFIKQGAHSYTLRYVTSRQLGFFSDHDELYWNVTGNGWIFPIEKASVTITIPEPARIMDYRYFTGRSGSKLTNARLVEGGKDESFISLETTAYMRPGFGFTVAVSWPKGIVKEPNQLQEKIWLIQDHLFSIAGLIGLLLLIGYYYVSWLRVGRDPEPGPTIPIFSPPKDISPAAARYIMRMGFDQKTFAAVLVNMAVKGTLKIEQQDKKYTLHLLIPDMENLSPGERAVKKKLFVDNDSIELKQKNNSTIRSAVTKLKKRLRTDLVNIYFKRNLRSLVPGIILSLFILVFIVLAADDLTGAAFILVWLTIWSAGVAGLFSRMMNHWRLAIVSGSGVAAKIGAIGSTLFFLPFIGGWLIGIGLLYSMVGLFSTLILIMTLVINGLFVYLIKAPTLSGRKIMDQLEGLRLYLSVAEKDRMDLLNPPEQTPELFEKLLPWALALDVEQQWCEQFADILDQVSSAGQQQYRPGWYGSNHSFSSQTFGAALGTSLAASIASSSVAPGSSSGFSGGGSSGGGGGGGGGGGW